MNIHEITKKSKFYDKLTSKQLRTLFIFLFNPSHLFIACLDALEAENLHAHYMFITDAIFSNYTVKEIDEILEREKWIILS